MLLLLADKRDIIYNFSRDIKLRHFDIRIADIFDHLLLHIQQLLINLLLSTQHMILL